MAAREAGGWCSPRLTIVATFRPTRDQPTTTSSAFSRSTPRDIGRKPSPDRAPDPLARIGDPPHRPRGRPLCRAARTHRPGFDASDDPLHSRQEGRFFYGHYCYLPLYVFCDEMPVVAQLRTVDRDGAAGPVEALERVVEGIRDP